MIGIDCVTAGRSFFVAVQAPGFLYGFERSAEYPKAFDARQLRGLLRGQRVRVYGEAEAELRDYLNRSTVEVVTGRLSDPSHADLYRNGMWAAKRNAKALLQPQRRDLRRLLG